MKKQNIPEELQELLDAYLTDGIISAKERQVLLKKASTMGIDADEFDLYIDTQIQKMDSDKDAIANKKRGKVCPYCGGVVPQLTGRCPHCNETITPGASSELQEIFNILENALVDLKSGIDIDRNKAIIERYSRKASMYYGENPKVQKLLDEIKQETASAAKEIKEERYVNPVLASIRQYFAWRKEHRFRAWCNDFFIGLIIGVAFLMFTCGGHEETGPSQYEIAKGKVDSLLTKKDFTGAAIYLHSEPIETSYSSGTYNNVVDELYTDVISGLIKSEEFELAFKLGLDLKRSLNETEQWPETTTYQILKKASEDNNLDFSLLEQE